MQLETTDCYLHSTQEEEHSSSILKQILEFGDDSKLFPETIGTSELSTSCSDRVGGGSQSGSNGSISSFVEASFSSPFSSSSMDPYALAALLNGPNLEPPIATNCPPILPLPPLSSPMPALASLWNNLNDQFDPSNLAGNVNNGHVMSCSMDHAAMPQPSVATPKLLRIPSAISSPIVFESDSLMTLPGMDYISHDLAAATCSFLDPTGANMGIFFPGRLGMSVSGDEALKGNMLSGAEGLVPMPELADFQTDFGGLHLYASETTSQQMTDGSTMDTQVFADSQNVMGVCGSPTRLPSDVASLAESTFKIGRLSVEERKEKIHRYMKKRSERNFSKKIKYACRKTLADSRPRVRGRFAKNDEFEEQARPISSNHDDNDDVMIKNEDLLDSSTMFSQLSSFRCNFTLESWI